MIYFIWIALAILCGIAGKDRECGSFYAFGWGLICPLIGIIYVAFSKRKKTVAEALNELDVMYRNGIVDAHLYSMMKNDLLVGKVYSLEHYTNPQNNNAYIIKLIIAIFIVFFLIKACIGL